MTVVPLLFVSQVQTACLTRAVVFLVTMMSRRLVNLAEYALEVIILIMQFCILLFKLPIS